ncbi:gibberellin 2-beta-dioxygenase 6 isoform X1 [Salvia miltiorrhiza]|uniref:gibberellin 2-beta-dioxygenase 6 isoform X1 n=2 Tax=Salvia miltiorrhiza TaxID=226208 RepID=UPI0025ACA6D2|nr:gibberellin 2-beta-dioxygenase 6 isoform X1 [Salvia miltiorrhiza]
MSSSHNFSSYPPFFRPNQPQPQAVEFDSDPRPKSCSLPIIDFEALEAAHLSQVCREWGMFRLTNHGVSSELLTQLHNHANKLFSHKFEWKKGIPTTPMLYFWGNPALTMSGNAQQKGPPPADRHNWLEGFNVSLTNISHFHYQDPLLESFRCLLEEYGAHQTRLAKAIFKGMAENLDFPPPKSTSYLSPATGIIRVYRYLRCPAAERRWGIHEHTDSSVLSIIHQDQVGGLQVFKNNQWLDVEPIHDTLIVNLGDMMQAMSDDEYVSVTHRVKVNRVKERVSIGYFVFPAEDGVIHTSNYKPFTYADFQAKNELDLKTLGAKIGLPRFRK